MESLFYPGSETWINADPNQTSFRFCLVDEENWNQTKRKNVNDMRMDQSHKQIQSGKFCSHATFSVTYESPRTIFVFNAID